jgi:hypothetical protein
MTTAQKEGSLMLQQIMQEITGLALKNAAGAQDSHQFSRKLVEVMGEFSALISQFKIANGGSKGTGGTTGTPKVNLANDKNRGAEGKTPPKSAA